MVQGSSKAMKKLLVSILILLSAASSVSAQDFIVGNLEINESTSNGPSLSNFDLYGTAAVSAGDVNGDGIPDIAVGAPGDVGSGAINRGAVHLSFLDGNGGVTSTVEINDTTVNGPALVDGDLFGRAIVSLGDLDGDMVPDIAVGAPGDDSGGPNRGAVYILLLNSDGTVKSSLELNSASTNIPTLVNGDAFGRSLANLGDLDGDGNPEIAVGATGDDAGGSDRGAVHILWLNADGSIKSSVEINSTTTNGPSLSDGIAYGASIAALSDVDGDGVVDLAVGTPLSDVGGSNRGSVYLSFLNADGSVKGSTEINSATSNGPELDDFDQYGTAVTSVGDLDLNGVADLAVGAPGAEGADLMNPLEKGDKLINRGAVHISFLNADGSVSSTVSVSDLELRGPDIKKDDAFGGGLGIVGDINGDSYPELLVGSPGVDGPGGESEPGRGGVYFLLLPPHLNGTFVIDSTTPNGPTLGGSDGYGESVASLGNLNGAGVDDIIVGEPRINSFAYDGGAVHISFLSAPNTVSSTVIINELTTNGPGALSVNDFYGFAVENLGTLDADSVVDIAVGAPGDDTDGPDRGAVYISYLNSNGSVKNTVKIDDSTTNGPVLADSDEYGSSIAAVGDLDGDGNTEIAVGAPGDSSETGVVHLSFLNADGTVKSTVEINGPVTSGDLFGTSITALGDLDGDLVNDIAVGAPRHSVSFPGIGTQSSGAVFVLLLNADGTVKTTIEINPSQEFGPFVLTSNKLVRYGSSLSFMPKSDSLPATLLVGAEDDRLDGNSSGAAYITFLSSSGAPLSSFRVGKNTVNGPSGIVILDYYGSAAAFLSDFNDDGLPEIVVGSSQVPSGGAGKVYISSINLRPPAMQILGNSQEIVDGDNSPTSIDGTDFGSAFVGLVPVEKSFLIKTTAETQNLSLTGMPKVAVSGAHAADFSVSVQPVGLANSVAEARFRVSFSPSAAGVRTATISVENNGDGVPPYTFAVQGTGANDVDTDGDGMFNSVDLDDDNDGLSDLDEVPNGTNPLIADTDGDGVLDGTEVNDGTDPLDAGSFIARFGDEVCVEWNGFLDFLTQIFELRNTSTASIAVDVTLFDILGAAQSSIRLFLDPGIQSDVIVNNLGGFVPSSFGLVCANVVSGPADSLGGQLSTYRLTSSSYSLAFAAEFLSALTGPQFFTYNTFQPSVNLAELSNFVANWVQLVNDESTSQSGVLRFYDFEGNEVRTQNLDFGPNQRRDIDVHSLGASLSGLVAWEPNSSTAKFRMRQNRYYYGSAGLTDLVEAVALPAKRGTGATLTAPFDTRDRTAALEISNTSAASITITTEVRDEIGSLTSSQPPVLMVPAKGTRGLVLNDYLSAGLGNVKISSDTGESLIVNLLEYGRDSSGSLQYASPSSPRQPLGTTLLGSYNSFLNQSCRIRVANSTAAAVSAEVTMTRFDGSVVLDKQNILVPARGAKQLSLCNNETQGAFGEVKLDTTSSAALVADIIRRNSERTIEFGGPLLP